MLQLGDNHLRLVALVRDLRALHVQIDLTLRVECFLEGNVSNNYIQHRYCLWRPAS